MVSEETIRALRKLRDDVEENEKMIVEDYIDLGPELLNLMFDENLANQVKDLLIYKRGLINMIIERYGWYFAGLIKTGKGDLIRSMLGIMDIRYDNVWKDCCITLQKVLVNQLETERSIDLIKKILNWE